MELWAIKPLGNFYFFLFFLLLLPEGTAIPATVNTFPLPLMHCGVQSQASGLSLQTWFPHLERRELLGPAHPTCLQKKRRGEFWDVKFHIPSIRRHIDLPDTPLFYLSLRENKILPTEL